MVSLMSTWPLYWGPHSLQYPWEPLVWSSSCRKVLGAALFSQTITVAVLRKEPLLAMASLSSIFWRLLGGKKEVLLQFSRTDSGILFHSIQQERVSSSGKGRFYRRQKHTGRHHPAPGPRGQLLRRDHSTASSHRSVASAAVSPVDTG